MFSVKKNRKRWKVGTIHRGYIFSNRTAHSYYILWIFAVPILFDEFQKVGD